MAGLCANVTGGILNHVNMTVSDKRKENFKKVNVYPPLRAD